MQQTLLTLDIDILLYGEVVVDEPDLTIPHPRMHERWFTLVPLAAGLIVARPQTLVRWKTLTSWSLCARAKPRCA